MRRDDDKAATQKRADTLDLLLGPCGGSPFEGGSRTASTKFPFVCRGFYREFVLIRRLIVDFRRVFHLIFRVFSFQGESAFARICGSGASGARRYGGEASRPLHGDGAGEFLAALSWGRLDDKAKLEPCYLAGGCGRPHAALSGGQAEAGRSFRGEGNFRKIR